MESQKNIVFVLGMHRSGTSALTKSLEVLGVDLGDNLMEGVPDSNLKGHFEDLDVYELNVEIMNHLDLEWHYLSILSEEELLNKTQGYIEDAIDILNKKTKNSIFFAIKDPRLSLLVPFWKSVALYLNLNIFYIIALRNPCAVAQSLKRRNNISFEKSIWLWYLHTISSLKNTKGQRRFLCNYNNHLYNTKIEIERIAEFLDLEVDYGRLEYHLNSFLDITLNHEENSNEDILPDIIKKLYNDLSTRANNEPVLINFDLNRYENCLSGIKGLLNLSLIQDRVIFRHVNNLFFKSGLSLFDFKNQLINVFQIFGEITSNNSIEIEFNITSDSEIKYFCWNPVEGFPCIVSDAEVKVVDCYNNVFIYSIKNKRHNGFLVNNKIMFYTTDQRIEFDFIGIIKKVVIKAILKKIETFEFERFLNKKYVDLIAEKEKEISIYKKYFEDRVTTLELQLIESKSIINNLFTSWSWRITRPLRFPKDIIDFLYKYYSKQSKM